MSFFVPGFIFPEIRDYYGQINEAVIAKAKEKKINGEQWQINNTPLEHYTAAYLDFEKLVLKKVKERKSKSPLKILDIGIGTGNQWLDFAKKHNLKLGRDFIVHGSALTTNGLAPEISKNVKSSLVSKLYKKFTPNYYDLIVSNSGIHLEPVKAAIENAIHLVKPQGDVIFHIADVPELMDNKHFKVIKQSEGMYCHLQKN